MKWYLFAKFFRSLGQEALMDYCAQEGLDGPTALVRAGYWTEPENLKTTLPGFVAAAKARGLAVKYADTPIDFKDARKSEELYETLASHGIELIRLAYVERDDDRHPRALADAARRYAETACRYGEKYSVRSVIQLHGGFYPHNATAAWNAVRDLDPRFLGVKIDPGNALAQEGYEHFPYQIRLLGEYVAALGAKDGGAVRLGDGTVRKGWQRTFLPAFAGEADYPTIFAALKEIGFYGPAILMPFYHEENLSLLQRDLTREIAYLKNCASAV